MTDAHPATRYPLTARFDYACVISTLAAADGEVSGEELRDLENLCRELGLPEYQIDDVLAFAHAPEDEHVRHALERLQESELRFTLITDMVVLGLADGTYDQSERKQVRGLAAIVGVGEDQVFAIEQYVLEAQRTRGQLEHGESPVRDAVHDEREELRADLAGGLAGVGVPLAAVTGLAGGAPISAGGFLAAMTSLGLGLGPLVGVGATLGLGFVSFHGVRWLYKRMVAGEGTLSNEVAE